MSKQIGDNSHVVIKVGPSKNPRFDLYEYWRLLKECLTLPKEAVLVVNGVALFQYSDGCKFTMYVKIIKELVNIARKGSNLTTLRDIYYKDVALFNKNMRLALKVVDGIARSMHVPSEQLLVVPGLKGLVYGDIVIEHMGTLWLNCTHSPSLIPFFSLPESPNDASNCIAEFTIYGKSPRAIVVLEKEAIFRSACNNLNDCILITGKGFPCRLTKRFLTLLAAKFERVPILAFVDSDVYGLQICNNYASCAPHCVSRLEWAGVHLLEYRQGWLNISDRNWFQMQSFLRVLQSKENGERTCNEHKWHREVTRGMWLYKKSEMNAIDTEYSKYIATKVRQAYHNGELKIPHRKAPGCIETRFGALR